MEHDVRSNQRPQGQSKGDKNHEHGDGKFGDLSRSESNSCFYFGAIFQALKTGGEEREIQTKYGVVPGLF